MFRAGAASGPDVDKLSSCCARKRGVKRGEVLREDLEVLCSPNHSRCIVGYLWVWVRFALMLSNHDSPAPQQYLGVGRREGSGGGGSGSVGTCMHGMGERGARGGGSGQIQAEEQLREGSGKSCILDEVGQEWTRPQGHGPERLNSGLFLILLMLTSMSVPSSVLRQYG